MADIYAYQYVGSNGVAELSQLTATSTGTNAIILKSDDGKSVFTNLLFAINVAAISTDVSVCLQGSLDNVNWFNLDLDEGYEKFTANGTYAVRYEGNGEILYIRLYFYSETGGTAATIDSKVKIFGKPVQHVSII